MNRILCCKMWLATRASYIALSELPAVSRKNNFLKKPCNKSFIDQVWGQDVWILALFFFASLWISPSSRPINTEKKNLANIQLSLASHLVNYPYMSVSDVRRCVPTNKD